MNQLLLLMIMNHTLATQEKKQDIQVICEKTIVIKCRDILLKKYIFLCYISRYEQKLAIYSSFQMQIKFYRKLSLEYIEFENPVLLFLGTANYCRKRAAPTKAEEGLSGRLPNHTDTSVGYYGDTDNYSDDVLEALDAEGRCVITLHKIR